MLVGEGVELIVFTIQSIVFTIKSIVLTIQSIVLTIKSIDYYSKQCPLMNFSA